MEWMTTTTILEKLRDFGDTSAWSRFVDRFRAPLLSFARRYGLADAECEDAVQQIMLAFAEAHRDGRYDRSKGRLSSWLFGIAFRQIADRRRKLARRGESPAADEQTAFWANVPGEPEAEAAWEREWQQAALDAAMAQAQREIGGPTFRAFELIVRQGRTPDQAAAELGMSRNAVYVAKHRVLKRLTELMTEFEA